MQRHLLFLGSICPIFWLICAFLSSQASYYSSLMLLILELELLSCVVCFFRRCCECVVCSKGGCGADYVKTVALFRVSNLNQTE